MTSPDRRLRPAFWWMILVITGIVLGTATRAFSQDDVPTETGNAVGASSEISPGNATIVADAQTSLIQNTVIAAPISGVVTELAVHEGDRIAAGSLLTRLEDQEARAEVVAARASLEAAEIESQNDINARYAQRSLEVNRREWMQSEKANEDFAGAISGTEIQRLRLVVDQSALAIEQALHEQEVLKAKAREKQAAMELAMTRLSKHQVQSLVSGIVAEVSVEKGQWVDQGQPLLRLISLDPIRLECFVDGRVYGQELVGRPIRFDLEASGNVVVDDATGTSRTFTGEVTFVSPELHPVTGQARLWATVANPDRTIRAGMRGQLIVGDQPELSSPPSATHPGSPSDES